MNRTHAPFLLMLLLGLAGCIGTSSQVIDRYDAAPGDRFSYTIDNSGGMSAEALGIFRAKLDADLSAGGLLAAPGSAAARRVDIHVTTYRMRHGAARGLAGIMAGKDSIKSTVTVVDAASGRELGSTKVESGNATAMGILRGLIEGHAEEIVQFLRGNTD